jgi:hypothetical protein
MLPMENWQRHHFLFFRKVQPVVLPFWPLHSYSLTTSEMCLIVTAQIEALSKCSFYFDLNCHNTRIKVTAAEEGNLRHQRIRNNTAILGEDGIQAVTIILQQFYTYSTYNISMHQLFNAMTI